MLPPLPVFTNLFCAFATEQVRYSATSQRVYFEHTDGVTTGGCATLSQILDFRQEKNGTVKVRRG